MNKRDFGDEDVGSNKGRDGEWWGEQLKCQRLNDLLMNKE